MLRRHQSYLFRQMNGPIADKLQRRSTRRLLVLATLACLPLAAYAITWNANQISLLIAAGLPVFAFASLLNMSIRGVFELDDELLDEFQIGLRNRVYKTAYGYTLMFLVIVATTATGLSLERRSAFAVGVFAFLASALAPRLLLAWKMENGHGSE